MHRKLIAVDAIDPKSIGPVSSDLKSPIGANRVANQAPFTDDELQRIIDWCLRPDAGCRLVKRYGEGLWTGEDVKDFIWVMVYTGLRISDVGLFHMNRLKGNEVFLRAKKNGGEVFAYIPDSLRDRGKFRKVAPVEHMAETRYPRIGSVSTIRRSK
jgi:hypothetical protein